MDLSGACYIVAVLAVLLAWLMEQKLGLVYQLFHKVACLRVIYFIVVSISRSFLPSLHSDPCLFSAFASASLSPLLSSLSALHSRCRWLSRSLSPSKLLFCIPRYFRACFKPSSPLFAVTTQASAASYLPSRNVTAPFQAERHETLHGGSLVADVLHAHGVKHIFTLVGGHISPILVACEKKGIRVVDTRQEVTSSLCRASCFA